jgi:antitoxin component YwqK of YwqJK toxin-antitoxin module
LFLLVFVFVTSRFKFFRMNKYFLSAVLVVVISLPAIIQSFAQTSVYPSDASYNVVDAKGFRQGYWKITAGFMQLGAPWTPDQVIQEGNYMDSKQEGVWVTYNEYGKKVAEVTYKKGRKDGPCKYFTDAGVLSSSWMFVNGKREGIMTTYYPDGTILMECPWSNGEIIGTMKTYYPSGKLYEEGFWANGWFVGDYKIYNENGTLKREALPPITQ